MAKPKFLSTGTLTIKLATGLQAALVCENRCLSRHGTHITKPAPYRASILGHAIGFYCEACARSLVAEWDRAQNPYTQEERHAA